MNIVEYREIDNKEIEKLILEDELTQENNLKNKEYWQIYSLYRKFFIEYILLEVNLKEYDNKLKTNELGFEKLSEDDMDFYQLFSRDELNYFYLRNNLYIEQLNKEEFEELSERLHTKNYEFDEKAKTLIKNTYKKTIKLFENSEKIKPEIEFKKFVICDGTVVEEEALIIGMKFNEFEKNGLHGEQWLDNHTQKMQFIKSIFEKMEKEFEKKLLIPVRILKY